MRVLIIVTALYFQMISMGYASSEPLVNVEKIDLNLKDRELAISFLGLSDGEATLIQGPNGENILVNAGGKGTAGELQEILKLYGVNEIQTLIITNKNNLLPDQIQEVMAAYEIKKVITTAHLKDQLKTTQMNQIEIGTWEEGVSESLFPGLSAEVLFAGSGEDEGLDFILQFFNHRLFLMTSFSQHVEEILLKKNLDNVNIFKVPNWAKENSLSEKLIQYVNPQISILFESEKHQPDPDIIHDLQDTWSEVFFTRKHGTVTIKFTETSYEVFTFPVEKEEKS
nr:hypothetical protein [Neobacillus sp. Marseille-Q6967]